MEENDARGRMRRDKGMSYLSNEKYSSQYVKKCIKLIFFSVR